MTRQTGPAGPPPAGGCITLLVSVFFVLLLIRGIVWLISTF